MLQENIGQKYLHKHDWRNTKTNVHNCAAEEICKSGVNLTRRIFAYHLKFCCWQVNNV